MTVVGSVFFILIAIIAIGIVIITAVVSAKKKKLSNPPLLTLSASVTSKRYEYKGGKITHCVSFNVAGKGMIELTVPADQFEILKEGEFGVLVYSGSKFFGFSKQ